MMAVEIGLDIMKIWVYHKVTVHTPCLLYNRSEPKFTEKGVLIWKCSDIWSL